MEKKIIIEPFAEMESSYDFLAVEAGQQSDLGFVCHHPGRRHLILWNIPFQPSIDSKH